MDKQQWRSGHKCKPDTRDWVYVPQTSRRIGRVWQAGRWTGDQELSSACVGFAWSHWLTCAPVVTWLDPRGLYLIAKHFDEWDTEAYEGTSVRAGAKVLKHLGLITEYSFARTLDEIVAAVLEEGPVVVGIPWTEDMLTPNAEGKIFATGEVLGGHAALIDGVHCDRRDFKVKSSWGRDWGINGHAWLDWDDFARLLDDGSEACIAVPREPTPLL